MRREVKHYRECNRGFSIIIMGFIGRLGCTSYEMCRLLGSGFGLFSNIFKDDSRMLNSVRSYMSFRGGLGRVCRAYQARQRVRTTFGRLRLRLRRVVRQEVGSAGGSLLRGFSRRMMSGLGVERDRSQSEIDSCGERF